ncbi:MAG: 5'-nucleotidase, lipoprotein e(P4) family [Bacteroidales bacterium]|nr:5'-nucleotidase, lipoprotein e(P4) family [Bacteroidales bacterium]
MKFLKFLSFSIVVFSVIILQSCNNKSSQINNNNCVHDGDYLHQAVLWYQLSGEMQACAYQAFNIAKTALVENAQTDNSDLPKAVVLDIDETIVDNSPFQTEMSLKHVDFQPEMWEEWSKMQKARALPGAVDFIEFAIEQGIEVFLVSNRMDSELDWTINNLKEIGFPELPRENYLFKTTTSNKKERRETIMQNFSIILFVGDNLGDFSNDFDNRADNHAKPAVDANAELFGTKYIILPNPTYGDWEKVLYDGSETPKYEQRRKLMISYEDL